MHLFISAPEIFHDDFPAFRKYFLVPLFMKNDFKVKITTWYTSSSFFLSNSIYLLPYCKKNTACLTFHKKTLRLHELKKVLSEIHWPIILLPMGFNNYVESIVQKTSGWPLQVKSERYWQGSMGTSSPYSSLISFFQEH